MKIEMSQIVRNLISLLAIMICGQTIAYENPKREFRGAWLHVIGQSQYQQMGTKACKTYISEQLDKLEAAGCNVVIFQVRPTADALYKSEIEGWSSWLTGRRGKAPSPMWDPMQYTIDEAHKRGMEFHAWLNPYRVTSSSKDNLPDDHLYYQSPERFVKFNGQIFFDPAYKENRDLITSIISDIVKRYDVDGIHLDDYFYPYPKGSIKFNGDDDSYAKFGDKMDRGDWRRQNVDLLIEQLHKAIKSEKSWVRFGISPFGIWRNKSSDNRGSDSSGLENYDDLYADVLLWDEKGWVDYLAPQLYWQLDLKAAPSRHLVEWWNDNVKNADLYIGQEVKRTMDTPDPQNNDTNELDTKVRLSRKLKKVDGNIWWHGYWVTDNYKGVADSLALKYQSTLALPPVYNKLEQNHASVGDLSSRKQGNDVIINWEHPENFTGYGSDVAIGLSESDIVKYVVYEFFDGETIDIEDSQTIVAITPQNAVRISDVNKGTTIVVTPIDRLNREGKASYIRF